MSSHAEFCSTCGSILPLLTLKGSLTCYTCSKEYPAEAFNSLEQSYEIIFNSRHTRQEVPKIKTEDESQGRLVDRRCPRCGHDKMSYETLQLRSADEGQTVFYTCINCKFKDTENS